MSTTKITIRARHSREFHTPEDFRHRTFFDAFADVFTSPEDLPLHQPDYGFTARIRDAHRIREDFRKAVSAEEKSKVGARLPAEC